MERTMISWNIANWITVILMGVAGWALIAIVMQLLVQPAQAGGGGAF